MTKRLFLLLSILFVSIHLLQAQCFPFVTSPGQTNDYITSFTIGSYTFNAGPSEEPCDYVITDSNVVLMSGVPYTFTIHFGSTCTNQYVGIWMDLNGDDQLSTPEMLYASTTPGSGSNPITGTLTIPIGSIPGGTLLRICTKSNAPVLTTEFCNMNAAGEFQDYLIYLDSVLPCSGMPAPSLVDFISCTSASNYNVIAKLKHVLKENGYLYQWELADDIMFSTNLTAIPNSNHPYVYAQVQPPQYIRCLITCLGSGMSLYSQPNFILLQPTSFSNIKQNQATSISVNSSLFNNALELTTEAGQDETGLFILYNATGQAVIKHAVTLPSGTQKVSIPTSHLANGFYYLQFGSDSYQARAIKVLKM